MADDEAERVRAEMQAELDKVREELMADVEKAKKEGQMREEALLEMLDRARKERWLTPENYPPALAILERENTRLRVDLQISQSHALDLAKENANLREKINELHESGAGEHVRMAVGELADVIVDYDHITSTLKETTQTVDRLLQRDENMQLHLRPAAVPTDALVATPYGVNSVLYKCFDKRHAKAARLEARHFVSVLHDECSLYRTLSWCLFGSELSHASVRAQLTDFIKGRPSRYVPFLTRNNNIETYCMKIRQGDLLQAQAACDRFQMTLTIFYMPHQHVAVLFPQDGEPRLDHKIAMWHERGQEVYCPVKVPEPVHADALWQRDR